MLQAGRVALAMIEEHDAADQVAHRPHAEQDHRVGRREDGRARPVVVKRIGGPDHPQRQPVVAQDDVGEALDRGVFLAEHCRQLLDAFRQRRKPVAGLDARETGLEPAVAGIGQRADGERHPYGIGSRPNLLNPLNLLNLLNLLNFLNLLNLSNPMNYCTELRARPMNWSGLLAGVALLIALWAVVKARRLARRLDLLQQSYWDLRYEHGRLRSQVKRLDPEEAEPAEPAPPTATTFIPLSSLKR